MNNLKTTYFNGQRIETKTKVTSIHLRGDVILEMPKDCGWRITNVYTDYPCWSGNYKKMVVVIERDGDDDD